MFRFAFATFATANAFTLIDYDEFNAAFTNEYCPTTVDVADLSVNSADITDNADIDGAVSTSSGNTVYYAGPASWCDGTATDTKTLVSEEDWALPTEDSGLFVAQISAKSIITADTIDLWAYQYGLTIGQVVPMNPGEPTYFMFSATTEDAQAFEDALSSVTAVMPLPDALKITASAAEIKDNSAQITGTVDLSIKITPGALSSQADLETLVASWQSTVSTVSAATVNGLSTAAVTMTGVEPEALATIETVLQGEYEAGVVDVVQQVATSNYDAKWITQSGLLADAENPTMWAHGLHGEDQVVAVADTGVDYQSSFFLDSGEAVQFATDQNGVPLFESTTHRKLAQYVGFANTVEDTDDGHGTHVAGSVLGETGNTDTDNDPTSGGGLETGEPFTNFNGVAYASRLAFYDIGLASGALAVPPNLENTMFPYAKQVGAYIHSDSWGAPANTYDSLAIDVDEYSWDNQDFLVLIAAGNSGPAAGTLGTPATAKNCLAVGASVNYYPVTPATELRLADFSSRGPASDGRIKPDISAPGFFVISAGSRVNGAAGHTTLYETAGTSMATPVTAGTASLLRQYFTEGFYPSGEQNAADGFTPMGALLKAMLINGGVELMSQAAGDLPQSGNSLPNMDTGFGRVTIDNTVYFSDTTSHKLFVHGDANDMPMATQGSVTSYDFEVTEGTDFKVTLVWHDAPGAANANKALVNDLDLQVSSAGPTSFPNGGTTRDSLNNVEHIMIPASDVLSTTYTVQVVGTNVAQGPQPYSLVVAGDFARAATLYPDDAPTVNEGQVAVQDGQVLVVGNNFSPTASDNSVSFSCTTLSQSAPTGMVSAASSTSLVVDITSDGTCSSQVRMTVTSGSFTTDPVVLAADSSTSSGLADTGASNDICTSADSSICDSFPSCDSCSGDDDGFPAEAVYIPIILIVGIVGATVFYKKNPDFFAGMGSSGKGNAVPTSSFNAAGAGPKGVEMSPTFNPQHAPPPRPASSQLPEGWERAVTPEGETYYFNVYTGASTWDRPMSVGGSRRMGQESGGDPTTWT